MFRRLLIVFWVFRDNSKLIYVNISFDMFLRKTCIFIFFSTEGLIQFKLKASSIDLLLERTRWIYFQWQQMDGDLSYPYFSMDTYLQKSITLKRWWVTIYFEISAYISCQLFLYIYKHCVQLTADRFSFGRVIQRQSRYSTSWH